MGRGSHRLGILLPGSSEDHRFRGYFGVSVVVAVEAWEMMQELEYLPPSPQFQHYLWALAFMRLYPANDIALSATLGGSDPKTIRKYIWPMIQSLFDLEGVVVSLLLRLLFHPSATQISTPSPHPLPLTLTKRFYLKTERVEMLGMTVCCQLMAPTFVWPKATRSPITPTSL